MTTRAYVFLRTCLVAILLFAAFPGRPICLAQATGVWLTVGESAVISANAVIRVAISAPEVADVTVATPSEVLVNGRKAGSATLYVWDKTGRTTYPITVKSSHDGMAKEIAQAIGQTGVSVKVINKTAVLSGVTASVTSSQRAEKVARAFDLEVTNLLTIGGADPVSDPVDDREVAVRKAIGFPDVTAAWVGNGLMLGGSVETQMDKARAEKIAALFSDKLLSFIEVRNPVLVEIEVKIVEINKQALLRYGIQLSYSSGLVAPTTTVEFSPVVVPTDQVAAILTMGALPGVAAKVQAQGTDTWVKVLSSPRLVTRAGEKAGIHVGGEFPMVTSIDGTKLTIDWKPFGIRLDVEPTVSSDLGTVSVKVQPEVSSLDWKNGITVNGVSLPALKTRKANTDVSVLEGSTLVLGGLIQSDDSKAVSKVPLLGDIPILGALFRSKDFQKGDTELVIFITPRMIRTKPLAAELTQAASPPVPGSPEASSSQTPAQAVGDLASAAEATPVAPVVQSTPAVVAPAVAVAPAPAAPAPTEPEGAPSAAQEVAPRALKPTTSKPSGGPPIEPIVLLRSYITSR